MKNCYCEKIIFDKMTPMRTMYTHPLDICMKKFYCQNNFCGKQLSCGGYLISIAYCLFFHLKIFPIFLGKFSADEYIVKVVL